MLPLDETTKDILHARLAALERHFHADAVCYYGEIEPGLLKLFRDAIEQLALPSKAADRLLVFLNTPGGSVETAEKMVEIMRFHYSDVYFVVPDYAMSAGTILCMSGDKIFMDYSSSLGPIDPQVFNGTDWVPALGYLDKVEQLLELARSGSISTAEIMILRSLDLATLSRHEQARDLTVTLLKRWLVQYKSRDWHTHESNPAKLGHPVHPEEKEQRAEEIARLLGNNRFWHSHGRMIGVETLRNVLKLRIDDYSTDAALRTLIRSYNDLLLDYLSRMGYASALHSRGPFLIGG